jgi:predicted ABC-type ATPase
MSALFIIAGPPGIGKSTSGDEFINPGLDILNEDEMRFRYKAKGYADYNEYSIHRVRDAIRFVTCQRGTRLERLGSEDGITLLAWNART